MFSLFSQCGGVFSVYSLSQCVRGLCNVLSVYTLCWCGRVCVMFSLFSQCGGVFSVYSLSQCVRGYVVFSLSMSSVLVLSERLSVSYRLALTVC